MRVSIPDATWLRGEGGAESVLLRPSDGKMCCLGHVLTQCGVPPEFLENQTTPAVVRNTSWPVDLGEIPDGLTEAVPVVQVGDPPYWAITTACQMLMSFNDDTTVTDAERKFELTNRFAKIGIEVVFENV